MTKIQPQGNTLPSEAARRVHRRSPTNVTFDRHSTPISKMLPVSMPLQVRARLLIEHRRLLARLRELDNRRETLARLQGSVIEADAEERHD